MHKERIMQVRDFLKDLPEDKFNIHHYVTQSDENGCGTVCCAIGWFPKIFPEEWSWDDCDDVESKHYRDGATSVLNAADFLEIPREVAVDWFYSEHYPTDNVKPWEVVEKINKFLDEESE